MRGRRWGFRGFFPGFKAAFEAADNGSMPKTRLARGSRTRLGVLRASACFLAVALPVAAFPASGAEPRDADAVDGPSCPAGGVARPLDSLQAAVTRAVSAEVGSGKPAPVGEVTVLNGRGYNYGPSLAKPAPPLAPPER